MSSRFLSATLATLFLASLALANKAPFPAQPVVTASSEAKLIVQIDPAATKPQLKIPASLIAPRNEPKRGGQAFLDNPMTLFAGLALCAAFVSGGFWLLRGKTGRTTTAALGILALALMGGSLFADLLPFPGPRPRPNPGGVTPLPLPANIRLTSDITVHVYTHPVDTAVYLIVPEERPAPRPGAVPNPPAPRPE